jgi:hypothetical protein
VNPPRPRPRILDDVGAELVRAARAHEVRRARRRSPLQRLPRAVVIGLGALLLLAAVAVAATLVIGRGAPIPPAPPGTVAPELQPVPGTARLNNLDVPDPDGGPSWDVRTSRSQTGATCATVGQVLDNELGLVGLDRRFRALPAGAADTCSSPQRTGATLAGARAFRGGGRLSPITVVNGVAAPSVRRAVAVGAGRTVTLKLGPGHAFLAIFRGTPEEVRPRVVLTDAGGHATTLRFADTGEYLTPDPSGGAPWTVTRETHHVRGDLRCVQAKRERGPDSPYPLPQQSGALNIQPPSVPLRCGARSAAFVDIRRFVPRDQHRGETSWWGLNPARTVVWGAMPRTRSTVVVTGGGAPRRVNVDPRSHGFALVLDGKVDPRALRVTVDGRVLAPMAGVTGRLGQHLAAPPVPPPWRSVASVVRTVGIPDPFQPDPTTVRIVRRANDVGAGPAWALRAWHARVNPRVQVSGTDRDLLCFQIGHEAGGGRLTLPRPGGGDRTLGLGEGDAFCNGPRWLTTHAAGPLLRVEVDDVAAPDPRPQRVVVAGLLGTGVRSAQLLGAGAPRDLDLGPDGTFLVVLPPDQAGKALSVRQTRADGTTRTSRSDGLEEPCRLTEGQSVRVADPDGGPPWAAGRSRVGRRSCRFVSRIVDGRIASIDERDGTVSFGPVSWGSGPMAPPGGFPTPPVRLEVSGPGMGPARTESSPTSPSQVARRTLPGRTIITGTVRTDVVSVTLRTPRDVRTLKPVDGLFLAVYDGAFYTGDVIAEAHLRNGRTLTERRPIASP